jgi:hypothetical protein
MVTIGAFLMLCVMTFDVGIFATVVVGQTIAHVVVPKPQPISQGILQELV